MIFYHIGNSRQARKQNPDRKFKSHHPYWDFGPGAQLKWNEIQNTPRHVQMLANYLLVQYKARVWNRMDRKG
jgi:hypothetical protein